MIEVVATDYVAIVCGVLCAMRGREGEAPAEPSLDHKGSYTIAARPPVLSANWCEETPFQFADRDGIRLSRALAPSIL